MATYVLKDRVKVLTATTGTGALTVSGPVSRFQTVAQAGVTTGATFGYVIEVPSGPWETGTAVLQADGTLTRTLEDSSTKALLALTGEAGTSVSLSLTSVSLAAVVANSIATAAQATVAAATVPTINTLKMMLADGTFITGTQLQTILGGTPTYATGYTTTPSAASAIVGSAIAYTVAPTGGNGTWTPGQTLTPVFTGQGSVSPASFSPSGSASVTFQFTPSAAGSGTVTINSSTPVLTNTNGTQNYTATAGALATAYTRQLSATTGATGAPVTITDTPVGGSWNGQTITYNSTVAGTFNPATNSPTGAGTTSTVFTPSAVGSAVITSTNSGTLTNPASQTYTVTASSVATYLLSPGDYPATFAQSFGGNAYADGSGQIKVQTAGGSPPASGFSTVARAVWTRSSTVPPVDGSGPNNNNGNRNEAITGLNSYAQAPLIFQTPVALWAKGSPVTGNYYLWIVATDGSFNPMVMSSNPIVMST